MRRVVFAVVVLLFYVPALVLAQGKEGSSATSPSTTAPMETWRDEVFSFEYPGDWTLDESNDLEGIFFRVPIGGQSASDSGFVTEQADMSAVVLVNTDIGPDEPLFDPSDTNEDIAGFLLHFTINGQEAASRHESIEMFQLHMVRIRLDDNLTLGVLLSGVSVDQIAEARPMALALLNSARLAGDEHPVEPLEVVYELPAEHVRPGEWRFNYPTDWATQDENSYTLLTVPGLDASFGLSTPTWNSEAEAADIDGFIGGIRDNVASSVPDAEIEFFETTVGDYRALQMEVRDVAGDFGYTQVVAYPGGRSMLNLTLLGPLGEVMLLEGIIPDLMLSMSQGGGGGTRQ